MAQIYFLKYDDISDFQLQELLSLVSDEQQQKVNRYADVDKKRQSLFAKLLLRAVLCRKFKIANKDLKFSVDVNGKPFVENIDNVYFSISHTSSAIAVAVSEDEIGVDIEKVRPANPDIAKRYFTCEEYDYILDGGEKQNERFFYVWTRKEARVKKSGVGFKEGFSTFSVFDSDDDADFSTYFVEDFIISESGDMAVELIGNIQSQAILRSFINDNKQKNPS